MYACVCARRKRRSSLCQLFCHIKTQAISHYCRILTSDPSTKPLWMGGITPLLLLVIWPSLYMQPAACHGPAYRETAIGSSELCWCAATGESEARRRSGKETPSPVPVGSFLLHTRDYCSGRVQLRAFITRLQCTRKCNGRPRLRQKPTWLLGRL